MPNSPVIGRVETKDGSLGWFPFCCYTVPGGRCTARRCQPLTAIALWCAYLLLHFCSDSVCGRNEVCRVKSERRPRLSRGLTLVLLSRRQPRISCGSRQNDSIGAINDENQPRGLTRDGDWNSGKDPTSSGRSTSARLYSRELRSVVEWRLMTMVFFGTHSRRSLGLRFFVDPSSRSADFDRRCSSRLRQRCARL